MLVICFLIILVLLVTQVVLVPLVRLVLIGLLAPIRRRLATKVLLFFDICKYLRYFVLFYVKNCEKCDFSERNAGERR